MGCDHHAIYALSHQYVRVAVPASARERGASSIWATRRPRCADFVVQHRAILPADKVAQLDDKDHDERLTGRRSGHTQVLAKPPAINAKGRVAGHLA